MSSNATWPASPPDERYYRYSVKCDRAFAARLDAEARKAGVSVTTLVQRHFETILGPAERTACDRHWFDAAQFDLPAFARRHAIPPMAARAWAAFAEASDAQRMVRRSIRDIGDDMGADWATTQRAIEALGRSGALEIVEERLGKRAPLYRLHEFHPRGD